MASPFQVQRVFYAALVASTVILAALGVLLPAPPGMTPPPVLPVAFGVLALFVAGMSFVLPSRMLDLAVGARPPEVSVELDAAEAAGFRAPAPGRRVVRVTDAVVRSYLPALQTRLVLGLALSESISLFGFVLVRLGADLRLAAPFFALGTLLALVRAPSKAPLLSAIARVSGAEVVDETTR
jgi:hypothetical protein